MADRVKATKVRPLLIRAGARFECFGDGLCCQDIHLIGPIGRADVEKLRSIDPDVVQLYAEDGDHVLRTTAEGACVFLGDEGCALHLPMGGALKPLACWHYPFGLVATPEGGRVTTEHRCPCRSMGDPALLEPSSAEPSVKNAAGRLRATDRVASIRLKGRSTVPFSRWVALEQGLIAALNRGVRPEKVLDRDPFPDLRRASWLAIGADYQEVEGSSRAGVAFQQFGDALVALHGGRAPRRARPWASAFDRAEHRARERYAESVFADFVADQIWALRWCSAGSFERARYELATRLAVGRWLARRFRRAGARPDRAAAEAVMVLDIVGGTSLWDPIVKAMKVPE